MKRACIVSVSYNYLFSLYIEKEVSFKNPLNSFMPNVFCLYMLFYAHIYMLHIISYFFLIYLDSFLLMWEYLKTGLYQIEYEILRNIALKIAV